MVTVSPVNKVTVLASMLVTAPIKRVWAIHNGGHVSDVSVQQATGASSAEIALPDRIFFASTSSDTEASIDFFEF